MIWKGITLLVIAALHLCTGCQFYPPGEYLRFVRVPENFTVGKEILQVETYPRGNLTLQPVDKDDDVNYFSYRDLNLTTISIILARSLEEIVDSENPRNVLKFKISCEHDDGEDVIYSSLSVTVYVEDLNDNSPRFLESPYYVSVEELTPIGLTLFQGIRAFDRDKPNTPNSDVQYSITAGNEKGKFALEAGQQVSLVLKKPLDYDAGDKEFDLIVTASDSGVMPRSSNTTIKVTVVDNDDQSPKFTKGVYRTKVSESYPLTGDRIHKLLSFVPPIFAYDQDLAINTPVRYDIIAGNERHLFYLNHQNGSLYLEKEIDLDVERSIPGNTFVLQIEASQIDNPSKTGVARVEVEILDLNDNTPEFEVDFYNISIVENLPNGFSVLQIIAVDPDQGDNAEFSYQLEDNSGAFALNARDGWLMVRDQTVLDREKRSSLTMHVFAREKVPSVVTDKSGASFVKIEVTLLDANDNNPTFIPNNIYNFLIASSLKFGDVVGQIHAIDPDQGNNGIVMYSVQKGVNSSDSFKIDSKTGQIIVNTTTLVVGKYIIFAEASDQPANPSERRFSLAVITVEVKNLEQRGSNKDLPDFIGAPYEFWVGGNVDTGTSVGQLRVTDGPPARRLVYDLLHSYPEGVPFAVEESSGTITVVDDLSKYNHNLYDFEAVVTSEDDASLVTNVTVHVVDLKENKNLLIKTGNLQYEFHVKENLARAFIGDIKLNNTNHDHLKFSIANQHDVNDLIHIATNGSLYTVKALDREERDVYRLTVIAEHTKGSGTGIYQVTVHVDDENDNAPIFDRPSYEGKIKENCISGTEVDLNYLIHVSDLDSGNNGQFSVAIFGDGSEVFRLERNTGKVFFTSANKPLDRESKSVFSLRLIAKDGGGLKSEAPLTIHVEDENDNPPTFMKVQILPDKGVSVLEYDESGNKISMFEKMRNTTSSIYALSQTHIKSRGRISKKSPLISLPEDVGVGTPIIMVVAEDKDVGMNSDLKYEMVSETYIPNERAVDPFHVTQYFMVHPVSGEISVAKGLPPESEFRLNVSASDFGGLKDHISVRILVKDVNDHPPIFKKSWYNFNTEEASYSRSVLGKIEAMDSDFGQNANVSYKIEATDDEIPFAISEFTGILIVNGELDREVQDKYSFVVIAKDNPSKGTSLSSSVNVEVNILDVNDNAPVFYGYDDVIRNRSENVPIYYATVAENVPIGTPVTRVFANDSDFTGNGNGLLLFNIPHKKNESNLFTVDSKEGIVTTIGKLDYEFDRSHNVTVVASDLGSPSLSSTALLVVTVIDVPEDIRTMDKPVFAHRYYEVEVEENVPVPMPLVTLNVTEPYRFHKLRYSIAEDDYDIVHTFRIDPKNGTLFIVESPDREKRALYELRVRLDQYKIGRDMAIMVYPVTREKLGDIGLNEVKVIVRITDVNDNVPKFSIIGRPIVAAITTSANFGHQIITLHAEDPDLGINGEVRYQILGRADDETRRFAIDPVTGQVRAIGSFAKDAGKMFGFDVKATDRRGADDGRSSIANVLVYVLDDEKQLVMVVGAKPTDVERSMKNISTILFNTTGFDVRVRKLEPHSERNQIDGSATDMYVYAVDPLLNVIVDMDKLQRILHNKQEEIERQLDHHRVLAITSGPDLGPNRSQRVLLSTLEVGVVVLGCIVFLGALVTAICIICIRRKKQRMLQRNFAHTHPIGYALATNTLGKTTLFPATFGDNVHYGDGSNMGQSSGFKLSRENNSSRYSERRLPLRERSRSVSGIEKSITSLHSSGHDSGIVDHALHCHCGQTSSQTSEDSSNYEDSLKSVTHRKGSTLRSENMLSSRHFHQNRLRNRSLSEDILQAGSGIHRLQHVSHIPAPPALLISGPGGLRRSTEHLVMAAL